MEALSYYPGSCGEIVQGRIDNLDMLISCPVNLFTKVRVFESQKPHSRHKYIKSSTLLENILKRWGHGSLNSTFDMEIESKIPLGKGLASSTADLCATYICLLKLFKKDFCLGEAVEELIRIEPTDSIIFREMTAFDYKEGSSFKPVGDYLKFFILAFEGQRVIDTVSFNKSNLPPLADILDLYISVNDGIKKGDIKKIADASTESIKRNFGRVNYEVIDEIEALKIKTGGLGILGGHSGDVLGIIYDDRERFEHALNFKNSIKGYMPHPIETLRRSEYERDYDYSPGERQR